MDGTEGALRHASHNNGCLCGYLAHMVNTLPFNWAWLRFCRQQVRPELGRGRDARALKSNYAAGACIRLALDGPAAG
jgi:hypothetical protein